MGEEVVVEVGLRLGTFVDDFIIRIGRFDLASANAVTLAENLVGSVEEDVEGLRIKD